MNCVTIALMVSAIVPSISGIKMTEGRNNTGLYTPKRERRNSQGPGTYRDWQWYLKDTAISMNVKSAWRAGYTGRGVLVAVVDDGVNMNHPDLESNFNVTSSYDFLKGRNISSSYSPGSHGTNCAGIIAGGNNTNCGVGIAFDAQIASIRLYDDNTKSTDQSEARALSHKKNLIDIYSNSWGPGDMGWQVEGPGPLLTKVLEQGTRMGRHQKGSIFVFAAGNGGIPGDSCAFSGYVNSIYTIAISAVNWDGSVPSYTEQCAAIMAVTYGQDMFANGKDKAPMITTKGSSQCTEEFSGTSATTAMASGIIALALEANPDLTWRDVQHLIARSSKPLAPQDLITKSSRRPTPSWRANAANLLVSSHYGFGLMDANKMVQYAKKWTSVPKQLSCEVYLKVSSSNPPQIPLSEAKHFSLTVSEHTCGIRYLEHVQVQVNLQFPRRGHLEMSSESPRGTLSKLLYPRVIDSITGFKNFTNWAVTSLHFWGENPVGNWNIKIENTRKDRKARQVNEDYSQWGSWHECEVTCGRGRKWRYRNCTSSRRAEERGGCVGPLYDSAACNLQPCPAVDVGYSDWSIWSKCSVTCGGGTQQRNRSCTNPRPGNNGTNCWRPVHETRTCASKMCPTPVTYIKSCRNIQKDQWCTSWKRYCKRNLYLQRNCAKTCEKCPGQIFSLKLILYGTKEDPLTNNSHVDKRKKRVVKFTEAQIVKRRKDIPIHGGYTQWSHWWSRCSASCGWGTRYRSRSCTNPPPANRGRDCSGLGPDKKDVRRCYKWICPVDGGFSDWSYWSQCSVTCGNGTQQRSRSCSNPPPANGGKKCEGTTQETRICSYEMCPTPVDGGYSDWSSWSQCSVTCDNGTQERDRSCSNPPPANGGKQCEGPTQETRICSYEMCPTPVVDGRFSDWSSWSQCSVTCGNGTHQRNRSCTNPPPTNNGTTCRGPEKETRTCTSKLCSTLVDIPIDGGYKQWSSWSWCSQPCGGGTQTRTRSCTRPPSTNGGKGCSGLGPAKVSRICNTFSCSVCRNSQSDAYCSEWKKKWCKHSKFRQYCKLTCNLCSVQPVLNSIQSPKN